ncbi:MAG: exodeoxyribonuclease VII small subunit [Bdellovibrionaceae bacterium]|nr:exodeoxyribonuclease VII small subunit [Bdellovibrionales bacterium]MCB9253629.1 exodeoxyribonuclease VII small subunit [Pseudobdellovibrionaceae bacterium]MCB9255488.1 exodeoxyribonuclease VII small subunit [Pseudobdellovibrionaceae bacterium]
MASKTTKNRSFETALADLEKTVGILEKGEVPLEEQLTAFEKGIAFSRECLERLEAVEKRVEKVLGTPESGLTTESFEAP